MTRVGFLHTSPVHIPLFDGLLSDMTRQVESIHHVNESLLDMVINNGITDEVIKGTQEALEILTSQGCEAITCTCSTLGGIVENSVVNGVPVQRLDRAVADVAMQYDRILVLAAIESAAEAADQLLEVSARTCASAAQWVVVLVPNAWTKFISGRQDAYERTVADFANQFKDEYDAVFLSQASMMGAAIMCDYENVLTSPGPGVQRLIDALGNSLTS